MVLSFIDVHHTCIGQSNLKTYMKLLCEAFKYIFWCMVMVPWQVLRFKADVVPLLHILRHIISPVVILVYIFTWCRVSWVYRPIAHMTQSPASLRAMASIASASDNDQVQCKKAVPANGGNNKLVSAPRQKKDDQTTKAAEKYKQLVMCGPKINKWLRQGLLEHSLVTLHIPGRANSGLKLHGGKGEL